MNFSRRDFLKASGFSAVTLCGDCTEQLIEPHATETSTAHSRSATRELMEDLLKKWCDGMLKMQIHDPDDPTVHGALACPSCSIIHGRCPDAVYPFLHMAHRTGGLRFKLSTEFPSCNCSTEND